VTPILLARLGAEVVFLRMLGTPAPGAFAFLPLPNISFANASFILLLRSKIELRVSLRKALAWEDVADLLG
jgi:hypothetical protein